MRDKLNASFALVVEAVDEVVRKRVSLLVSAFPPIAGIYFIDAISAATTTTGFSNIVVSLAQLPLYVMFATVVHRIVLLGENAAPSRLGIFWTERETRFLGWLIGILLLYVAVWLPTGLATVAIASVFAGWDVTWLTTILSYLVIAYFDGRFGLVLPATATDQQSSFKEAWAISRGKGMMIALALVIPAMIFIPIEWVLYGLIDDAAGPLVDLIWLLLAFPVFAVEIAIISIAYAKLSQS